MYTVKNFRTKKELKEAIKNGEKIGIYQPNNMFGTPDPKEGTYSVEGPWYPKPHTFYASVTLKEGYIVSVK